MPVFVFLQQPRNFRRFAGSDLKIRQLIVAAKQRNKLASQISEVADLEITFYNPGIIHFGIELGEYL